MRFEGETRSDADAPRSASAASSRAPTSSSGGALRAFLQEAWSWSAGQERALRLALSTAAALVIAASLRHPHLAVRMQDAFAQGSITKRAYEFFELHQPLGAWWLLALSSVTVVSSIACVARFLLGGSLAKESAASRGRCDSVSPREAGGAVGRRDVPTWGSFQVSRSRLAGLLILVAGAASIVGSAGMERWRGICGEVLVEVGGSTDVVYEGYFDGEPMVDKLGFTFTAVALGEEGLQVELDGGSTAVLAPKVPVRVGDIRLRLRESRTVKQRKTFLMSVIDETTGEELIERVSIGESFGALHPEGGYGLEAYEPNLQELGAAVRARPIQDVEGPLEKRHEPFWIFERYPDFDARNRDSGPALALLEVSPAEEVIVAIVRHPGLPWAIVGAAMLLLGLSLSFSHAFRKPRQSPSTQKEPTR